MSSKFMIKEILSISFHPIPETNKTVDQYKRVMERTEWEKFLEWYSNNVGRYESHSVSVADRIDINNVNTKERIAGIYLTPAGNEYYIRQQEHELWIK